MPYIFPFTDATLPVVSHLVFLHLIILPKRCCIISNFLFVCLLSITNSILFPSSYFVNLFVLFSKPFFILLSVNSIYIYIYYLVGHPGFQNSMKSIDILLDLHLLIIIYPSSLYHKLLITTS